MALDSVHPLYQDMRPDWDKMRVVYKGERHVKDRGTEYLPPTKGMLLDGYGSTTASGTVNIGFEAYNAYRLRAVLPEYVRDAVEIFVGLLHSNPPVIELPASMEDMRDRITVQGESMELLLRRINEEQLVTGRLGLMLDLPKKVDPAKPMPHVAMYITESIRNWDDGEIEEGESKLNLVVLDESGYRRNGFEWEQVTKYRVLELTPMAPATEGDNAAPHGPYRQGVYESEGGGTPTFVESDMKNPMIRGGTLNQIPFVFVNSKDILASPDDPPLLGLADAVLTIYRGEADYRQNLFLQGQDTLVVVGDIKRASDPNELASAADNDPLRTGTGAMIHLETGGTAEYIGVDSAGLPEQRTALENDRRRAEGKSSALSADTGDSQSSGEALKTRVGARTASLNQIAKTGAAALEWILKLAAEWMGANPDEVKVTPNLEFADFQLDGASLAAIVAAKQAGAPLSWESIHKLMAKGNLTELDYQTEKDQADAERAEVPPAGTAAGGNPEDDKQPGQGE